MEPTGRIRVFAVLVLLMSILTGGCPFLLDGKLFSEDLRHLADEILGADDFQKYINTEVTFESELLDNELLDMLTISLENMFQTRLMALEKLRDAIEKEYGTLPVKQQASSCCTVVLGGNDTRFGNIRINDKEMCVSGETKTATKYLNDKILDVMKSNLRNVPSLKSQYFGNEQGSVTTYPAYRHCDQHYDPRFRPWYVESVTPEPKDVVIVIDKSVSMNDDNLIKTAINSAVSMIDTLNPNDRVGIILFNHDAYVPSGSKDTSTCYRSELAKATPHNKNFFKRFVRSIKAHGGTVYSKALAGAFQFFKNSKIVTRGSVSKRDQAILFITDGKPREPIEDIKEAIREGNRAMNNSVVILTFGLGNGVEDNILTHMAHQIYADPKFGEIKQGQYIKITDKANLRYAMTTYYNIFSRTGRIPAPVFSVPYIDTLGLGLITSACLPVFYQAQLQGVTCVDIALADLLSDITYFQEGEFSYAFMINGQGRFVTHPLLPRPSETYDDPVFVTMTSLETFPESQAVMESMMRGKPGNGTFNSTRVRARGNTKLDGVIAWSITSKYYWRSVKGTNFSVCLVIGEGDQQAQPSWAGPFPSTFFYHVLHLQSGIKTCNHFNRLVVQDRSAVVLTAEVFENPFQFITRRLSSSHVTSFWKYLTGRTNANPGFKKGIRDTVAVTYKLEEIVAKHKGYQHAVWLYIGTENGVFRQYPGVRNALRYNHKVRPWYEKAMGEKDHYSISTPYWDASGTGWIITLGVVIYERRSRIVHTPPPMGVMAMDFPMSYFYDRLLARYQICRKAAFQCTVIDKSGFLVAHKDFTSDAKANDVENIHITAKDPQIADELIKAGIMTKETCVNHQHIRYQKYWKVTMDSGTRSFSEPSFELHAVEKSNIFIIFKHVNQPQHKTRCHCHTAKSLSDLSACVNSNNSQLCECPCYSPMKYNFCRALFSRTSNNFPSCIPDAPVWKLEDMSEAEGSLASLNNCYDFHCERNKIKSDCRRVLGCTWCISHNNATCIAMQDCYTPTVANDAASPVPMMLLVATLSAMVLRTTHLGNEKRV